MPEARLHVRRLPHERKKLSPGGRARSARCGERPSERWTREHFVGQRQLCQPVAQLRALVDVSERPGLHAA